MCESVWYIGVFFFKQKTAYEMRISDWSSDVCSSDLIGERTCHTQRNDRRVCASTAVVKRRNRTGCDLCGADRAHLQLPCGDSERARRGAEIGRASCRARVCQSV